MKANEQISEISRCAELVPTSGVLVINTIRADISISPRITALCQYSIIIIHEEETEENGNWESG